MGSSRHVGVRVGPPSWAAVVAIMLAVTAFTPMFAQEATPAGVSPYVPPEGLNKIGGTIEIDGSSTVFPVVDEIRLQFEEIAGGVEIQAEFSGTGGGFTLASARDVVPLVGHVPLPDADYAVQQAKLEAATVGNVPPDGP